MGKDFQVRHDVWVDEVLVPFDQVMDDEGTEFARGRSFGGRQYEFNDLRALKEMDIIDGIDPSYTLVFVGWPSNIFPGKVLAVSDKFVVQDIGNKHAKVHVTKDLTVVPAVDDMIRVTYVGEVGQVEHIKAV